MRVLTRIRGAVVSGFSRMSGQTPGRKRPARPVAPTQQTQVPVPGPEEELTGDISDDPADKTVVLKAGPGTSDPSASTTAMVPDPVLVSTTTATSATDLATPFLDAPAPPVSQARASLEDDEATTQLRLLQGEQPFIIFFVFSYLRLTCICTGDV